MSRRDLLLYLRDLGWSEVELPGGLAPSRRGRQMEAASSRERLGAGGRGRTAQSATGDPLETVTLEEMAARLASCRRCRLCQGRKQVVFGVGHPHARVMFVGEAPGADEDRLGEPFVGRAGQLLNAMLRAIDLRREEVYIANVIKCRPPGNRDPQDDEAATCLPFLRRQAELIEPEVVVCLGRVAARHLLGTNAPISSYRGRWMSWSGRAVLPTFHPAYLLRNPAAKAQAWADLKKLKERLGSGLRAAGSGTTR